MTKHSFKVGDGATIHRYSDAHAFTVIKVTATTITLQRDKATLLNGGNSGEADALQFSAGGFVGHTEGTQRYSYEADPNGSIEVARLVPEPAFKSKGQTVTAGRHEHYDYNF
jgi:hypothetical protein